MRLGIRYKGAGRVGDGLSVGPASCLNYAFLPLEKKKAACRQTGAAAERAIVTAAKQCVFGNWLRVISIAPRLPLLKFPYRVLVVRLSRMSTAMCQYHYARCFADPTAMA